MEQGRWHRSVVYQVYPRNFQDSSQNGIGNSRRITSRLDYLAYLGIDVIWLSPVCESPNDDNGYDIGDYQAIVAKFGTMKEMEGLTEEAEKRNIRIIMDLVVNHTSDERLWFIEVRENRENPYRNYYIWYDPVNGKESNRLRSIFNDSAWQLGKKTGQYFLHLYSKRQPDLNQKSKQVHQKIYQMMNFWTDKDIGGFHIDVIDMIGEEPDKEITSNEPRLHEYPQEMNQATFGDKNLMTVGEIWGATTEIARLYSNSRRSELSAVFQFEHIGLDRQEGEDKWDLKPLSISELKKVLSKWWTSLGDGGWSSLFWNNHGLS